MSHTTKHPTNAQRGDLWRKYEALAKHAYAASQTDVHGSWKRTWDMLSNPEQRMWRHVVRAMAKKLGCYPVAVCKVTGGWWSGKGR